MQKMYTSLGFTGMVEWLLPGDGMRPSDYGRYVDNLLYGFPLPFIALPSLSSPLFSLLISQKEIMGLMSLLDQEEQYGTW
jgi:hypothetical protein